ncbi:MAG: bifunctional nicotinamidase/pyrazinamidase [Deltaproteobacteria bacterium]
MPDSALIVIDVQNDFCPNGRLAVAGGDVIIPAINALMDDYKVVVLTQDWHPADHASFAALHANKKPYDIIEMPYGPQILWPVHCVQGSEGAAFHAALDTTPADMIVRKGFRREIDSYSAFYENDHKTPTGLDGYLKTRKIKDLTLVGLATDFCVAYSAIDAAALGFRVTVIESACRAIDLNGSLEDARKKMKAAGVKLD